MYHNQQHELWEKETQMMVYLLTEEKLRCLSVHVILADPLRNPLRLRVGRWNFWPHNACLVTSFSILLSKHIWGFTSRRQNEVTFTSFGPWSAEPHLLLPLQEQPAEPVYVCVHFNTQSLWQTLPGHINKTTKCVCVCAPALQDHVSSDKKQVCMPKSLPYLMMFHLSCMKVDHFSCPSVTWLHSLWGKLLGAQIKGILV